MASRRKLDLGAARAALGNALAEAESALLAGQRPPPVPQDIQQACAALFSSATQAYREVLLGCVLARLQIPEIDVRQPYAKQGPRAFSARTLDERVINPLLHEKRIPCSRGPYLSVFRRSVRFDADTREGLRDKEGYDALLAVLSHLELLESPRLVGELLVYLLFQFLQLREQASVSLTPVHRLSLEQIDLLVDGLLNTPSGGRLPVILVVATLESIKERFGLDWTIEYQGINVADVASGTAGDIQVRRGAQVLFAAEVTERQVGRSRVVATFATKVAPAGVEDYLFFGRSDVATEARQQAHQYFAQGHEVNFLAIREWIRNVLGTIGRPGRDIFHRKLLDLLEAPEVPAALRAAWNEQVEKRLAGTPER